MPKNEKRPQILFGAEGMSDHLIDFIGEPYKHKEIISQAIIRPYICVICGEQISAVSINDEMICPRCCDDDLINNNKISIVTQGGPTI